MPQDKSAVFILIKTSQQSGHWTAVARNKNNVYYFDSYSIGIDGELKNISADLRYELGESEHLLSKLFKNSQLIVHSNSFHYQSHHEDINTCGKWCVIFVKAIFDGLSMKAFKAGILHMKLQYFPDKPYALDLTADMIYDKY